MIPSQLKTKEAENDLVDITTNLSGIELNENEEDVSSSLEIPEEQTDPVIQSKEKRSVFCCQQTMFYKPRRTDHEDLFSSFIDFENNNQPPKLTRDDRRGLQVVRQRNFGPVEEKRYFSLPTFEEISESDFSDQGYKRLNSFKNLKCNQHNLFFEINAYKKDSALSQHHLSTVDGSTYSRDSANIDLAPGKDKGIWHRYNR